MAAPHLLVVLSAHGYGHVAQTAPVVNALRGRIPDLRLTVQSAASDYILRSRIEGEWQHIPQAGDFGMVMHSAVSVDVPASAARYLEFHRDWPARVASEAARLAALAPDLILCNIAYLPLAGAARAGIPAVAYCSLNWADIFHAYCAGQPDADRIHAEITAAYQSAQCVLQTEPHMPMTDLPNRRAIGPVAHTGTNRRREIATRIGLAAHERLVVIAPGGMPLPADLAQWPRDPTLRYVVPDDWRPERPDAAPIGRLGLAFTDVLASSDALVGKPGYGSVVECAHHAVPFLYVKRGDWPEEPYLLDWLHRHGRAGEISRGAYAAGAFREPLETLRARTDSACAVPSGITEAVEVLARQFSLYASSACAPSYS